MEATSSRPSQRDRREDAAQGGWSLEAWSIGPDWRWQRALRLAQRGGEVHSLADDPLVRTAAAYLRLHGHSAGPQRAGKRFADVASAIARWSDADFQAKIKIVVVSGMPQADVAATLGVEPALVALVEALFFDVRPALAALDWILLSVIRPLERAGNLDLAAKIKVAFSGGPAAAKALVDGAVRVPQDIADRLQAQELLLHAKFQAALEYPLAAGDTLEFLKLALDYEARRERVALQRAALAHRCEEDRRRHERQMKRLEIEAARQGSKAGATAAPEILKKAV